jgi:hypothetical protein
VLLHQVLVDAVFRAERPDSGGKSLHDVRDLRLFEALGVYPAEA